jgi:hypothetical protein
LACRLAKRARRTRGDPARGLKPRHLHGDASNGRHTASKRLRTVVSFSSCAPRVRAACGHLLAFAFALAASAVRVSCPRSPLSRNSMSVGYTQAVHKACVWRPFPPVGGPRAAPSSALLCPALRASWKTGGVVREGPKGGNTPRTQERNRGVHARLQRVRSVVAVGRVAAAAVLC